MKKLIVIILVLTLISFFVKGQVNGTITVQNESPDHVCKDGAITINFKFKTTPTQTLNPDQPFSFMYEADNGALWLGYNIKCSAIFNLPKTLIGTDTIYQYLGIIPSDIPLQHYLMYGLPNKTITGRSFWVSKCVGIEEYELNTNEQKTYYDLMGNKIDRRNGELIIEQIGNYRHKILIQE